MTAIPVIETERLRLRPPVMGDLDAYADYCASARSEAVGGPFTRAQAFQRLSAIPGLWTLRGYGRWMIADRATDEPFGVVGPYHPDGWPEPEIAWTVFGAAEGKGVAFEAARRAIRWVYDALGWTTAISCIPPGNDRSVALARRLGATPEAPFIHPEYGQLDVWRHRSPEAFA